MPYVLKITSICIFDDFHSYVQQYRQPNLISLSYLPKRQRYKQVKEQRMQMINFSQMIIVVIANSSNPFLIQHPTISCEVLWITRQLPLHWTHLDLLIETWQPASLSSTSKWLMVSDWTSWTR